MLNGHMVTWILQRPIQQDGWEIQDSGGRQLPVLEWWSHWLSKILPDNSTLFAAEATAITLALDYYRHMGPVRQDVVYSDSMSCLQAIEGEDTENPLISYIMNLIWVLSNKGTHARFWSIPNHCVIEGNERGPASKRDRWPWHWPTNKVHFA